MTPAEFATIQKALGRTQGELAADLGVTDRQVRHYAADTRPIPDTIEKRLRVLLHEHQQRLRELQRNL